MVNAVRLYKQGGRLRLLAVIFSVETETGGQHRPPEIVKRLRVPLFETPGSNLNLLDEIARLPGCRVGALVRHPLVDEIWDARQRSRRREE